MSHRIDEKTLFEDPGCAWEPYRPGNEASWDAARVAHLHRRAGFAATWGQLERDLTEGFEPSLRRILDGESQGPSGQPASEFADTIAAMEESARRRPSMELDEVRAEAAADLEAERRGVEAHARFDVGHIDIKEQRHCEPHACS